MKKSLRLSTRVSMSGDFSAAAIPLTKRSMNHVSEYWYIGSTTPRSAMQKNRRLARVATGLGIEAEKSQR